MNVQLGMSIGTATHRLRKSMMFRLAQRCGLDVCCRCKTKITKEQDLTLDHVLPWRGEDTSRFWDLDNLSFAHARCNFSAARRRRTTPEEKRRNRAAGMRANYSTEGRRSKKLLTGW